MSPPMNTDQLIDLNRLLGELKSDVTNLRNDISNLHNDFASLERDVSELKGAAARWKGAFGLILVLGSAVMALLNLFQALWERH